MIKILFISATCSKNKYNKIYKTRTKPMIDSSQKFFDMFLNGFSEMDNIDIECLSILPVSSSCYKKKIIKHSSEKCGVIKYNYLGFINLPIIRNIILWFKIRKMTKIWCKKNKDNVSCVICDALILEASNASKKIAKKFNIKTIGFLTDLPKTTTSITNKYKNLFKRVLMDFYDAVSERDMKNYDGYIFLTESMNNYININKKPYIIMECLVDRNMAKRSICLEEKYKNNTVIYAGKLHKKFGVDILSDAVDCIKSDCKIVIYGDGDYFDSLKIKEKKNNKLEVNGIVPIEQIVNEEMKSTILINPRPTNNDFTKYSFPSKIAEYMVSGTVVLTTKLSGIPKEYYDYLFFINDETPKEVAASIDEILSLPKEVLYDKGLQAKKFVLENKRNDIQAERFIHFLKQMCIKINLNEVK